MKRDALALGGVLAAALLLRVGNLGLIHDRGDQLIWAGLARHVAATGMDGFTIRNLDIGISPVSSDLAFFHFRPGDRQVGSLLDGFKRVGEDYWDRPIANQPPLFTLLLVASHRVLGREGDDFPLLGRAFRTAPLSVAEETAIARAASRAPPPGVVRAQLWATLPVLLSDLVTVALVFALARRLGGSRRAALVAAAIFACDPLAIFCAHRVLSNPTLATATTATALALVAAERDRRFALLSGTLAGLSMLVKASGLFLIPVGWRRPSHWLTAIAIAAPWALLEWKLLGNPLGFAWESQKHYLATSAWGRLVVGRGPLYYLESLARSPLVLLGLATSVRWLLSGRTPEDRARRSLALFVALVLAAAHHFSGGKEARHIELIYPLLAVAASEWVDRLRGTKARPFVLATFAVALVLGARSGLGVAFSTAAIPP